MFRSRGGFMSKKIVKLDGQGFIIFVFFLFLASCQTKEKESLDKDFSLGIVSADAQGSSEDGASTGRSIGNLIGALYRYSVSPEGEEVQNPNAKVRRRNLRWLVKGVQSFPGDGKRVNILGDLFIRYQSGHDPQDGLAKSYEGLNLKLHGNTRNSQNIGYDVNLDELSIDLVVLDRIFNCSSGGSECLSFIGSCRRTEEGSSVPADLALAARFDEIKQYLQNHPESTPEIDALVAYRLLLVPGLFGSIYNLINNSLRFILRKQEVNFMNSWLDLKNYLDSQSIDYQEIQVGTQKSCEVNGNTIAEAVRAQNRSRSGKRLVLIGHSKGGVDILHALTEHPDMRGSVSGWLSMQSPLFGTRLTNITTKGILSPVLYPIMKVLGGDSDALRCLSTNYRTRYNREKTSEINEVKRIQALNFASWIVPHIKTSSLYASNKLICALGEGINDGLVPINHSCLQTESCLHVGGIDHAGPVMDVLPYPGLGKERRVLLFRALLILLLEKMEARDLLIAQ